MVMDQDIRKLAGSLKASGVAASMMEAMEKAREILVGSEKTLDIMKKYTDDKNREDSLKSNQNSIESIDSQINSINEEIATENKEIDEEINDVKEIDMQLKSNDDLILEEINKISNVISGSKIDSLELPPTTGQFSSGKSLNELYSDDATVEQVKETVVDEAPMPEETEIVMDSSETTHVEESSPSPVLPTIADELQIEDSINSESTASSINEIEQGLNDELQKIEIDNPEVSQNTESDSGSYENNENQLEQAEQDASANMDAIIEDPSTIQETGSNTSESDTEIQADESISNDEEQQEGRN